MTFLLHVGSNGLECPFLAQKSLIGLKKGLFIPKVAFLESFCHYKQFFAIDNHFFGPGKTLVSKRIIMAKKSF